jgi:hypothetical protein
MAEASTAELVKDALDEAKELVQLEVALAKEEVKEDLRHVRRAAIGFGVGLGASLLALTLLAMSLVFAIGATALVALLVAGGFLVTAALGAYVGYALLPKRALEKTRSRLQNDVNHLKEHIA